MLGETLNCVFVKIVCEIAPMLDDHEAGESADTTWRTRHTRAAPCVLFLTERANAGNVHLSNIDICNL
jgi:hypothetical protein